jgi:hypothetical protein
MTAEVFKSVSESRRWRRLALHWEGFVALFEMPAALSTRNLSIVDS